MTSGGSFFLGRKLISWLRKKQDFISQCIAEAKYVAATKNCNQIIWMKQMLIDVGIEFTELDIIHCDKKSIVSMSKNPILYSNIKHISINYHFLR